MKKSLFSKVFALLFLTALIACGDDDSKSNGSNTNPNDKIIGSWVYNGYYNEDGTFEPDDTNECFAYTITFNSDGKGNEFEKDCQNGDSNNNMTWENRGSNAYKITFSKDYMELINVTFTSDTQADVSWDGGVTKERFTRK